MKIKNDNILILIFTISAIVVLGMLSIFDYNSGTNRLLRAIGREDVAEVQRLLDEGVDPNRDYPLPNAFYNFFEHSPDNPLTVACNTGNLAIVELLIEYGATAEPAKRDRSPLAETVLNYYQPDDLKIVESLLEHGARNDEEDYYECIFEAANMIPKVYDANKTNGTVFLGGYDEETAKGITEIVITLLEDRDINITTSGGNTLLMNAARSGHVSLVQYLLLQGCDATVENAGGKTALDYAIQGGHQEVVDLLNKK